MATVLLVGAGLLTHSFVKLSAVDNGYDPSNVLAFNLLFPDQYSIARKADTIETLLARLRRQPERAVSGLRATWPSHWRRAHDRYVRAAGPHGG